jgi:hypothetical protein
LLDEAHNRVRYVNAGPPYRSSVNRRDLLPAQQMSTVERRSWSAAV